MWIRNRYYVILAEDTVPDGSVENLFFGGGVTINLNFSIVIK